MGEGRAALPFFSRRPRSPVGQVTEALEENRPIAQLPTQMQLCILVWSRGLMLLLLGTVISCVVGLLMGKFWALATAAAYFAVFLVLMYFTLRSVWAAAYVERRLSVCGYGLAVLLLVKSTGLEFSGRASGQDPWYTVFEFGETNNQMVWAGVIVFVVTQVLIVILQLRKAQRA